MTAMPHLAAMAWDHADRLQHADLGGGGDVWFVYDAAGERVRKVQVNVSGSVVRDRVYLAGVELYRDWAANSATPTLVRESLHVGDDTGRLCLVETLAVRDGVEVASPVSMRRHQYGNHPRRRPATSFTPAGPWLRGTPREKSWRASTPPVSWERTVLRRWRGGPT